MLNCHVGSGDFTEPNIDCVTWFLVITVYVHIRPKGDLGKKDTQNIQFAEKMNAGYLMLDSSLMLKEMRSLLLRHQMPGAKWNTAWCTLR